MASTPQSTIDTDEPVVLARLCFQKLDAGVDEWGEVVLHGDGSVRLRAGDVLRGRLADTANRVDRAALMYGATGFMGVAAVGTALVLKRRALWGYVMLFFAALIAVGASWLRVAARDSAKLLDADSPRESVHVKLLPEGGLTITFAHTPPSVIVLRLEAGEFDSVQASNLIALLKHPAK